VHPQIAWAKLESLAEGAALASRELWAAAARKRRPAAASPKASDRVTAPRRAQAASDAAAKTRARRTAVKTAAARQTAGEKRDKTGARAIQAHVQARGRRRQARRDSR
jgi:hypothetical protein